MFNDRGNGVRDICVNGEHQGSVRFDLVSDGRRKSTATKSFEVAQEPSERLYSQVGFQKQVYFY
ncbi:hypothetical protein JYT84_00585 [bacterium AH-315-M10]|nr:hypothetical protein [bacterium AH-315-M10]